MIQSMTGFGRAETAGGGWRCTVELRSVNNRFLDVRVKLPQGLSALEETLKKALRGRCERGKVDGSVTLASEDAEQSGLVVNRAALERYASIFREVSTLMGQPVHLSLGDLINAREPILTSAWESRKEDVERLIEDTFGRAADALLAMRRQEGQALTRDLRERSALLRSHIAQIAPLTQDLPTHYARKLRENLARLMEGTGDLGPLQDRIAQEIALFAERCDVSEELTRFNTHLENLEKMLEQGGALGRKFEFILQELNREANTLSVKSSDVVVSAHVIEIKTELERLREQIQNIE
jgi:uncharacterized protein (TIGR00255 family)